jgi:hypothetical protein
MTEYDVGDELEQIKEANREAVSILRGIEAMLDQLVSIAEMQEESISVLVWQGMPWWRRLRNSWHDAKETLAQTETEQGKEGIIFRTTDGT